MRHIMAQPGDRSHPQENHQRNHQANAAADTSIDLGRPLGSGKALPYLCAGRGAGALGGTAT
jgi:hypothetical protein